MKLNKDDWAFKVNIKTGEIEMAIPKVKAVTPAMVFNVLFATSKLIGTMHSVMENMMAVKNSQGK